jgi:hypothetical protein
MKAIFASVCTAGVVAGILTAAAATGADRIVASARRDTPAATSTPTKIDINRVGKTDRWSPPRAGTILVKTLSIPAASYRQEGAASREVTGCEPLVSPLADRVASRRARQCAT